MLIYKCYQIAINTMHDIRKIQTIKIKRHANDLKYKTIEIKDGGYIHKYDKPIRSWSYMERLLVKTI